MIRLNQLALAGAGAAAVLILGAAQRPAVLTQATPGLWEISGLPGARAPVRECLSDMLPLAQFEHRSKSCTQVVISDGAAATVIRYTCNGGDYGQSKLSLLTPRSLRIETQGISEQLPFYYVLQARRVGECPSASSASAH